MYAELQKSGVTVTKADGTARGRLISCSLVTASVRLGAIGVLLAMIVGLLSSCGRAPTFTDDASGRTELLKALRGKYEMEFSVVSGFSVSDYRGTLFAEGIVAPMSDSSTTALATLSEQGHLTDNYSAQAFRSQVAGPAERICGGLSRIATCTVVMHVPNAADRWDQGTLDNFLKKSGVELRINAFFAAGLDDETYASQGFQLVSALEVPRVPFLLEAYRAGSVKSLFGIGWSPGDRPGWITKAIIMDHINIEKMAPTVK